MITIFSTLKPFTDPHIKMIQRNAIQSWVSLSPKCQVILLGNNEGAREAAKEFDILHIPNVEINESGLPLIRSLFREAQKIAKFPILCYVNGDIIFTDDFLKAIKKIASGYEQFLCVGRRWDTEIRTPISFDKNWQKNIKTLVKKEGALHGYSGIDYFVFTKGMFQDIPPLVVGRGGWDNWMIYDTRKRHIPVIDVTKATTVVHQGHDLPNTRETATRFTDEYAEKNREYAGGYKNLLTIRDANGIFDGEKTKRNVISFLSFFYPWRLAIALKRKIR